MKGQNVALRTKFESLLKISCTHLIGWPSTQAVWLIVVQSEDLDSSLDAQVMQDTSHFQRKEVILKGKVKSSVIC